MQVDGVAGLTSLHVRDMTTVTILAIRGSAVLPSSSLLKQVSNWTMYAREQTFYELRRCT